ncbi:MAG TPA: SDR family NAD(P)-dependent oxidoreductase [Pseudonocardiaceae bacterium]|jgi:NAD(P)-dependent dehydrogenase (short-subunit alcohol dehydrogenase family)|nr:SDR family NAD(P)-dependent oxidoreductase [Pseudonocardiaceae bacterium]
MRILVTGGSAGLGAAIAARFAADGAKVLIADINEPADSAVPFQKLDVRSDEDWARVRDWVEREWDGLDVLVNNAGVASAGRIERLSMADWDWILDINLKGVVRGCRTFVPMFKRQGHGHLVNMASLAGLMNLPGMDSYNVSKSGVISLSETLRYELAPYGVRTTVVCPAFVPTSLGSRLRSPDPVLAEAAHKMISAGKVSAEDVAGQVFDAVRDNRFLVLTHREGRIAVAVKRFAPWLVDRQVRARWLKVKRKLDKQDAEEGTTT